MSIYYSAKENAFYDDNINEYISNDAIEISAEQHSKLLADQSKGFVIQADENGYPIAIEIKYSQAELDARKEAENIAFLSSESERTEDEIKIYERMRDRNRADADDLVMLESLEDYSIDLKKVTKQKSWPLDVEWPIAPNF